MPKVDPKTGVPMTDDPDQADPDLRGGKQIGDEGLDNATANGDRSAKKGRNYSEGGPLQGEQPSDQ